MEIHINGKSTKQTSTLEDNQWTFFSLYQSSVGRTSYSSLDWYGLINKANIYLFSKMKNSYCMKVQSILNKLETKINKQVYMDRCGTVCNP